MLVKLIGPSASTAISEYALGWLERSSSRGSILTSNSISTVLPLLSWKAVSRSTVKERRIFRSLKRASPAFWELEIYYRKYKEIINAGYKKITKCRAEVELARDRKGKGERNFT